MGWGNESLFKRSWRPDQDGRHAHIWLWNLVCSIGCSSTINFIHWWPWVDLDLFYGNLYGEKGKRMDFSETIVVYDLKVATDDRCDKKFLLTSKQTFMHMAGRSLKEKYNTKYYKIYFILFSVNANKFRWTKAYILAIFTLVEAAYFGWHEHQRCIVAQYPNIMIMASYCMFCFYSHRS